MKLIFESGRGWRIPVELPETGDPAWTCRQILSRGRSLLLFENPAHPPLFVDLKTRDRTPQPMPMAEYIELLADD